MPLTQAPVHPRRYRLHLAAVLCASSLGMAGCAVWAPPPMTAALQAQAVGGDQSGHVREQAELSAVPFQPLDPVAQARHCGPQALAMALAYAGQSVDLNQLTRSTYLPARGGSLQVEVLAAARRSGGFVVPVGGGLQGLIEAIDAGQPVLLLQNLGLPRWPSWHYAVLVGYDRLKREFVLRSGEEERQTLSWATFEHTWTRAGQWAVVVLAPGQLPPTPSTRATPAALRRAALDFEAVAPPLATAAVWRSLKRRWPEDLVATVGLGNSLLAAGHTEAAADLLRQEAPRSESVVLWNNLAQVELARGDRASARDAAVQALQRSEGPQARWRATVQATLRAIDAEPAPR